MALTLLDTRSLSDEVRTALRRRAVAAREAGFATDTIAAILGVRPASVSRWFAAYQGGGAAALPGDRGRCRKRDQWNGEREEQGRAGPVHAVSRRTSAPSDASRPSRSS